MGWYIVASQKKAKNEREFGFSDQSDPFTVDWKRFMFIFMFMVARFKVYVPKKCIVYIYLLKAIFLLQWNFRDPKLKQIEGAKMLASPIPQNVTSSILQSVNILILRYLNFFASNRKISLSGAKIIKKPWSDNFWLQRY